MVLNSLPFTIDAEDVEEHIEALLIETVEAESEMHELFRLYERYNMADHVVEHVIAEEMIQEIAYEDIEKQKDGLWTKIVEGIKKFIGKIQELWQTVVDWVKTQIYELDYKSYIKHKYHCNSGIARATASHMVNIHKYMVHNPSDTILKDIEIINEHLEKFYKTADELVTAFMTPDGTANILQRIARIVTGAGSTSVSGQIRLVIKQQWDTLKKAVGITETEESFTTNSVKEMIRMKYFGTTTISGKEKQPIKEFVSDMNTIDRFMDPSKAKVSEEMCTRIRNGSSKLHISLQKLDKFVKENIKDAEHEKIIKDMEEGKQGAISIMRTTLSICNSIGTTYWSIFLAIRGDVKTCIREYCKISKGK